MKIVQPIPTNVSYRNVKRAQSKSNSARLRRRSVAKGWLSEEEAKRKIPDNNNKYLKLPFVKVKSSSSGQQFRLFIDHGSILEEKTIGTFNAYGLSSSATIPWF